MEFADPQKRPDPQQPQPYHAPKHIYGQAPEYLTWGPSQSNGTGQGAKKLVGYGADYGKNVPGVLKDYDPYGLDEQVYGPEGPKPLGKNKARLKDYDPYGQDEQVYGPEGPKPLGKRQTAVEPDSGVPTSAEPMRVASARVQGHGAKPESPEQQLHHKFEGDVAARAQGLLKANKDRLNREQTQYAQDHDPKSDRWSHLWQVASQRREFQRQQANLQQQYEFTTQEINNVSVTPDENTERMATAQEIQNSAKHKRLVALSDQKHRLEQRIAVAKQMQVSLEYAYPALAAVKGETGANPQDIQAVQGRLPNEFNGIRRDIDRVSQWLSDDPSNAWLFDSVVAAQLKDKSLSPAQRQQLAQQAEKAHPEGGLMLGTVLSGGLFAAAFVPALQDLAIPLLWAGIGVGGAVAASEIPDLMLLDAAAQAGRGGHRLTSQSPEQAKFNLVMGYGNVALAALDVGAEVGVVQKLAGVTGELATAGVQVSRQTWSQVMSLARRGPEGLEKARELLASIKGISKEKVAEVLRSLKGPQEEIVGVPGQSSIKTTEENVRDAQTLQSKGSGSGEYKKPKIIADLEKLPNAKLFAPNQLEHVIFGNENKVGKFTGWHHFPSRRPGEMVKLANDLSLNQLERDSHGVYKATVEASFDGGKTWIQKTAKDHTFFPDEWSREKVIDEIKSAFKEGRIKNKSTDSSSYFQGRSKSGVLIEGHVDANGEIKTAYPLYGQ
jgi:Bacterial EndoU nuclease